MKRNRLILLLLISIGLFGCQQQRPKNMIIMISDGCGYNQMDATSYYEYGKTGRQVYEQFPVIYAMQTYSLNANNYTPDSAWTSAEYVKRKPTGSAAAATALASGVKTKNGYIGMDSANIPLENMIERLEKYGKASGVVTSVQLSHATPAGFVAHNKSRKNYEEIADEMFRNSKLEVIIGCGHPYYDKDGKATIDTSFKYVGGKETWLEMVEGTLKSDCDGDGQPDAWKVIQDMTEFINLASGDTPKRLLGIAQVERTLQEKRSGDESAEPFVVPFIKTVPSLSDMVRAALNVLDNDPDGLFLMVEGGAIDWTGHANLSGRLIEEQVAFNRTVTTVVNWIEENSSWDETLLIVTSDHETGFLTGPDTEDSTSVDELIRKPLVNKGKGKLPGMKWNHTKHTNMLVPFFAKGAGSGKFSDYVVGTDPVRGKYIDNTSIAKLIFSLFE